MEFKGTQFLTELQTHTITQKKDRSIISTLVQPMTKVKHFSLWKLEPKTLSSLQIIVWSFEQYKESFKFN